MWCGGSISSTGRSKAALFCSLSLFVHRWFQNRDYHFLIRSVFFVSKGNLFDVYSYVSFVLSLFFHLLFVGSSGGLRFVILYPYMGIFTYIFCDVLCHRCVSFVFVAIHTKLPYGRLLGQNIGT